MTEYDKRILKAAGITNLFNREQFQRAVELLRLVQEKP